MFTHLPLADSFQFRSPFGKLIDLVLGVDADPAPSAERMRNEYLIGFLILVLPIIFLSFIADLFIRLNGFSIARLTIGLFILTSFILIRVGRSVAGIDLLFFGCIITLLAGFFSPSTDPRFVTDFLPLIDVVLFAAVTLYGIYASDNRRLLGLFILAALFDITEYLTVGPKGHNFTFSRMGILVLHAIAYGLSRFLRMYFERLTRIAEARRVMNRRLEELVAEARTFGSERLASFSHDIRSPITGILGVHDLLLSTKLDGEQQSYLGILGKSNRLLLEIVESILDQDQSPDRGIAGSIPLRAFIDDALAPYRTIARSRNIVLRRHVYGNPPPLPLPRADAARVIGNLVDNALKYTDSGSIVVSINEVVENGGVDLVVADSGRGMSAERLAAIRGGDTMPDGNISSSRGLGLTGVRRIVESVGAVLLIESVNGKGTKITIRFPLPEDVPSGILS
ncbi:MAG: HAMP domain-containing sensor histidine kinase [Treponemataceae bacterium]